MFIELSYCVLSSMLSVFYVLSDFILPAVHGVGNHYSLYFVDLKKLHLRVLVTLSRSRQ